MCPASWGLSFREGRRSSLREEAVSLPSCSEVLLVPASSSEADASAKLEPSEVILASAANLYC